MRRALKAALAVLAALFVLAQFYPVDRSRPAVRADLDAPDEVERLLRAACYDCHSYETRWPWYGYIAPASWVLRRDVRQARGEMNFSEWGLMRPKDRARLREEMWEEIDGEEMPLPLYRLVHPAARLTPKQRATLRAWMLESEAPAAE